MVITCRLRLGGTTAILASTPSAQCHEFLHQLQTSSTDHLVNTDLLAIWSRPGSVGRSLIKQMLKIYFELCTHTLVIVV